MDIDFMLKNIPDKRQYKETTSLKFKEDLIELFGDVGQDYTVLCEKGNYNTKLQKGSFQKNAIIFYDNKEIEGDSLFFGDDEITSVSQQFYNDLEIAPPHLTSSKGS